MTMEFDELPKRVQNVITKCRSGEKLTKSLRLKEGGDTEISFAFEPSGKRAPPQIECGGDKFRPASAVGRWTARRGHVSDIRGG